MVCLAILSVEDIKYLYIFGTMITGYLLIGLGITLVYRKIRKMETAVQSPIKLPDMIEAVGRAVGVVEKRIVRLIVVSLLWEIIEQTVTETCTFQHARKFLMTSVCDIPLYLSISLSVYVAQTQSLLGACCLRMLLHLRHYLDRVHSDLNNI